MPTNEYLASKIRERASQSAVIASLQQLAADEKRDLSDDELKSIDAIEVRCAQLDATIAKLNKVDESASKFMGLYGGFEENESRVNQLKNRQDQVRQQQVIEARMSVGERFTASEQFKEYGGRGATRDWRVEDAMPGLELRSTPAPPDPSQPIMTPDFGGTPSQLWSGPAMPALRTPLFDVIGRVPTNMGSVQYYYWFQNPDDAASVVPEGQQKPPAPLQGELITIPIQTFAWWKAITRQALDDIPLIQTVIDTQLQRGIIRAINNAAADALNNNTDIQAAAGGTGLLGQIRVAIAQIDEIGYSANAVLLNPLDWAELDTSLLPVLQRDINAPYGPLMNTVFWGLRPIPVPSIPQGTAYVGDFAEGLTYFDRQQTSLLMTDSHDINFTRNVLVLLAEARGAVAVTNAAIIIKCTGSADEGDAGGNGNGGATPGPGAAGPPPVVTAAVADGDAGASVTAPGGATAGESLVTTTRTVRRRSSSSST